MRSWLVFVLLVFFATSATRSAYAQCGARRSSCSACHDGARAALPRAGQWHTDHAFADLCPSCHGGRGDTFVISDAHTGLVDPIASAESQCAACHGARTEVLARRYSAIDTVDAGASGAGGATSAPPPTRTQAPAPPPTPSRHGRTGPNVVLSIVIGIVGLSFGAFALRHQRAHPIS